MGYFISLIRKYNRQLGKLNNGSGNPRVKDGFFHLLKVINLLIEYLGILSSANALAGRSTALSAGSGSQACPGGQISAFSAGSGAQACPDRRLHCPYAFCARGPCCSCQKRGEMKWPKRGQQNTEIPA